jgi:dipeptidyl-peptidase 4
LVWIGRALAAPALIAQPGPGQPGPGQPLTVDRIFKAGEFRGTPMPTVRWMRDGHSYIDIRPVSGGGSDIIRTDVVTGEVSVLASAADLNKFAIEDVALSPDESLLLLFHDSVRLWRTNTRGTYHVFDLKTRKLTPLSSAPGLQMFAKFSPDGRSVAFARDHDLWVVGLGGGDEHRLTTDGSADIINGTTDWAYEEELHLRDAFRWSPDSRRIAYWRFDQSRIPVYPLLDDSTLYPRVLPLRYPKAGEPNSLVKIGVVDVATAATTWLDVGGDTGIYTGVYVAQMSWSGTDSLQIERLPRRQNQLDVLMVPVAGGATRTVLTDRDSAYVDVTEPVWVDHGRQFLWLSDRGGWRSVYLYDRAGKVVRQITANGADVLSVVGVDETAGTVYVVAAAPDPTQRQIYRYRLRGGAGVRVTTTRGTHAWNLAPGSRWAVDVHSTIADPQTATVVALPDGKPGRVLVDNAALARSIDSLGVRAPEFMQVPMPDGSRLDAYRIVPPAFDSTRHYPVLMYVYGGPAAPTVVDGWGGNRYLWHQLLAQMGYVVVSVDNRGAAWRGRAFRKGTELRLGAIEARDQVDAARWLGQQAWADATRIGIWGWSFGGYLTSRAAEEGGSVFKAAISVAPVTDWRLYDSIYTERYMWIPSENAAGYDSTSVDRNVAGLSATLLLVHGTGDDNVHPQNSIQYAAALEAAGKPFYMLLYPNRTHAISGGNSQAHLFESLTRFVREQL